MKKLKSFAKFIGSLIGIFVIFYGICYEHYRNSDKRVPLSRLMDNIEGVTHMNLTNSDIVVRVTRFDEVVSPYLCMFTFRPFLSPSERLYLSPEEQQKLFYTRNKAVSNYYYYCSAFSKRKNALTLSQEQYSYKWFSYATLGSLPEPKFLLAFHLDGVSNVIYNVSYLASIPNRVIVSCHLTYSIIDIIHIILGGLSALFMLPVSFLIGTICHPWETLANLTVGIIFIPPDSMSVFSWDYWSLWWDYVCNTNIIASLWDLLYHGVIRPLRGFFNAW